MSRRRRHQLAQELSEVLKRRFSYETHLDRYKRIYKVLINEIAEELHAEEETILHALYFANYVISSTEIEAKMTDEQRARHVVRGIVEGLKQTQLSHEQYVQLLKLTHDVSMKLLRLFLNQKRVEVPPEATQVDLVDTVCRPLFEVWFEYTPKCDFRWIMAELDAPLRKQFSHQSFEELKEIYPIDGQSIEAFFDAGLFIVDRFIEYWNAKEGLLE